MPEPQKTAEPLLEVDDIHVDFRGPGGPVVRAVNGVSFTLAANSTLALVGESGSGKSTLSRAVLRLVHVRSGEVRFAGVHVLRARGPALRRFRRDAQIVFQDVSASLNPRMRVRQIIAEPMVVQRLWPRREIEARVFELLSLVGLEEAATRRFPHEFSGGQRQRIGIARALASRPRLLVLDEPVSALDVSVAAQVLNMLSDLKERLGLAYLFVTHNLAIAQHFSDRVAVMYRGGIVEIGETRSLYGRPLHPYTLALLAAVPGQGGIREVRDVRPGDAAAAPGMSQGCPFASRCPWTSDRCRNAAPALRPLAHAEPAHLVACHHAEMVSL